MSVENVERFKDDFKNNNKIKDEVKKELEKVKDRKKEEKLIPEIARKLGYDFTDEEYKKASKKVSDEELANVSGGLFGESTPDGHEVDCWFDYYEDWYEYYWHYFICCHCGTKNAGTRSLTLADVKAQRFKCEKCGQYTYLNAYYENKDKVQGPKIGKIN